MKSIAKRLVRRFGYDIVRYKPDIESYLPPDLSRDEREIYEAVAPFTMTSIERVVSLVQATKYILENKIEGDIVECGVWRGGSMMAVAYTLLQFGDTARTLYLYDTFTGMPEPTSKDRLLGGTPASQLLANTPEMSGIWCYADEHDVLGNLKSTGYPENRIRLIQGRVEDSIPRTLPNSISLLRLDTDWYESTKHELVHLYPKLTRFGILIIDDYGHWMGAKEATDEYFEQMMPRPLLQRIDYTGRLIVKI